MKQILITLSVVISSFFAQATDKIVSPSIETTFENRFSAATNTFWTEVNGLYKAAFVLDGRAMSAFFNGEAELIAVTKNISTAELPEGLRSQLQKELSNAWISELFVMSTNEGDQYYVNLEGAHSRKILKSENNKKWSLFEKSDK
jgi:hypothetical protein